MFMFYSVSVETLGIIRRQKKKKIYSSVNNSLVLIKE